MKKRKFKLWREVIIIGLGVIVLGLIVMVINLELKRPTFYAGQIISTGTFDGNSECVLLTEDYFGEASFAKLVGYKGTLEFVHDEYKLNPTSIDCYSDPYVITVPVTH